MAPRQWAGQALGFIRPGMDALTGSGVDARRGIAVISPVFKESEAIRRLCTADGEGRFPGVEWSDLPEGTRSLVLLVEDADIPLPIPVTHLIVHSIDPALHGLEPGAIGAFRPGTSAAGWACGRNFLGAVGWTPPAPPPGHGLHRYAFQVFALDERPLFRFPPRRGRLMRRITPHIIGQGRLVGTYQRH